MSTYTARLDGHCFWRFLRATGNEEGQFPKENMTKKTTNTQHTHSLHKLLHKVCFLHRLAHQGTNATPTKGSISIHSQLLFSIRGWHFRRFSVWSTWGSSLSTINQQQNRLPILKMTLSQLEKCSPPSRQFITIYQKVVKRTCIVSTDVNTAPWSCVMQNAHNQELQPRPELLPQHHFPVSSWALPDLTSVLVQFGRLISIVCI